VSIIGKKGQEVAKLFLIKVKLRAGKDHDMTHNPKDIIEDALARLEATTAHTSQTIKHYGSGAESKEMAKELAEIVEQLKSWKKKLK